jgi:hypothetical protein
LRVVGGMSPEFTSTAWADDPNILSGVLGIQVDFLAGRPMLPSSPVHSTSGSRTPGFPGMDCWGRAVRTLAAIGEELD